MLRGLVSQDPRRREAAAGEVTDVMRSLEDFGGVVAGVLVAARLAEENADAQEAQLHALAEMHEWGMVPDDLRGLLTGGVVQATESSQIEYLDYLRGDA